MARQLTREFDCNIDLTVFSCRRVQFQRIAPNRFSVRSNLVMPRSCMSTFVERLLKRRAGQYKWFTGNASKPTGYLFEEETHADAF